MTQNAISLHSYLLVALLLSQMILDGLIAWTSIQGSIRNSHPRRHIVPLIYASLLAVFTQICNQIYGMTLGEGSYFVWMVNSVILLQVFFVMASLLSSTAYRLGVFDRPRRLQNYIAPVFWTAFLLNRQRETAVNPKDVLKSVASLLTTLFGNANLCPSDVLVGLLLVQQRQQLEKDEEVPSPSRLGFRSGRAFCKEGDPLIFNLSIIAHLSQYAEAMYGLPLFIFANFGSGLSYLCCPCAFTHQRHSPVMAIERTMDVGCSTLLCCFPGSWIAQRASHPDLLYKNIKGHLFKSPFAVSVDRNLKAIVIAVRGTLSTSDLLVDLYIQEQELEWMNPHDGTPQKALCHGGMMEIARSILMELNEKRVFTLIESSMFEGFQLICTVGNLEFQFQGHSLGAGVAALLAFLIKNSQAIDLRSEYRNNCNALCYSSPGFLISKNALCYFCTFCTSVVLGDDFICRINPHNTEQLKKRIEQELELCELRKIDILSAEILDRIFRPRRLRQVDHSRESILQLDAELEYDGVHLYLPGNVLLLKRMHDVESQSAQGSFLQDRHGSDHLQGWWTDARLLAREIIVSDQMIMDHLPNRVGDCLRSLVPRT